MLDETVQHEFSAGPGYLNTASVGLPPKKAVAALRASLADWEKGRCDPASFDEDVDRARRADGKIVGADLELVGIVSQVSVVTGLVASSLAQGATVLCAEEDFTSVLFPFLADARLDVQLVPVNQLIDRIGPTTDLVAVTDCQSHRQAHHAPSVPRDVYRAPRGDGFGERTHEPLLRCRVRDGAIRGDPRDP